MAGKLEMLTDLYRYVRWADRLTLEVAGTVPEEGFYREQNISAGSIHKLLVHAMAAQHVWLSRWQGDSSVGFPSPDEFPTLEVIRGRWAQVHDALFRFLASQTEQSLERVIRYTRRGGEYEGVLWQLMTHVADHATYHRGQLNSMVKLTGGKPTDASYINYRRETEGQA